MEAGLVLLGLVHLEREEAAQASQEGRTSCDLSAAQSLT